MRLITVRFNRSAISEYILTRRQLLAMAGTEINLNISINIDGKTKNINFDADISGTIHDLEDYIMSEIRKHFQAKIGETILIKLGENIKLICKRDQASHM